MKIPGLSNSDGMSKPLPQVYVDTPPKPRVFGHFLEGEDQLSELWDNGQIDKIFPTPIQEPREPIGFKLSTVEQATGRPASRFDHYTKPSQPTIFGPDVLLSNTLELRSRLS